jgi:predicted secreted protein
VASKQINARDLLFQVLAADGTTWNTVTGITTASIKWDDQEQNVDITTYDDAGAYSQEIMQRGASLQIQGRKKQDSVTGVYDVGQARLDTLATTVGVSSQGSIRFRYPVETTWRNWTATVTRSDEGGGSNDKVGFSYTVMRCGAQTTTAAP